MAASPLVVVTWTPSNEIMGMMSRRNIEIILYGSKQVTERHKEVKGILVPGPSFKIDDKIMDTFPNVQVINTFSDGYCHIDINEATKRGIRVGNTPDCLNDCTADMGFTLLLGSARNLVQGDAISKSPTTTKFDPNWYGVKVTGSTLGIVGLGRIGSTVAQRAKGFNMKVLYHNRNKKDSSEEFGAEYCPNLDDLLRQSDFVIIVVPSTPQTIGMFTSRQFSLMKPTSTLINIARGNIVNQDDLVEALQNGTIRAAALDVTDPEPLPRDHPLLKLQNIIITPHIATATGATVEAIIEMGLDNLEAGLRGDHLPHSVNNITPNL